MLQGFAIDPINVGVISAAVLVARLLGRFDQAIALAQYLVSRAPLNEQSHDRLAMVFLSAGRLEDALSERHRRVRGAQPRELAARTSELDACASKLAVGEGTNLPTRSRGGLLAPDEGPTQVGGMGGQAQPSQMPKVAALTPTPEYRKYIVQSPTRKSSTPPQSSNKPVKPIASGSKVDKAGSAGAKFAPKDAVALLKADHKQVAEWFAQFESARSDEIKRGLAQQICAALTVHATIEEEIFYPAFLESTEETDLHHEAEIEHQGAKNLIAEIEKSGPEDEYFDARVTVLAELIRHHVNEEEQRDGMFAKAKESDMDLEALGEQLQARKDEMTEETPPQRRVG